jgi:hypothetical protein
MEEISRTTSEGYARMRSSKTINSEVIALESCKEDPKHLTHFTLHFLTTRYRLASRFRNNNRKEASGW